MSKSKKQSEWVLQLYATRHEMWRREARGSEIIDYETEKIDFFSKNVATVGSFGIHIHRNHVFFAEDNRLAPSSALTFTCRVPHCIKRHEIYLENEYIHRPTHQTDESDKWFAWHRRESWKYMVRDGYGVPCYVLPEDYECLDDCIEKNREMAQAALALLKDHEQTKNIS